MEILKGVVLGSLWGVLLTLVFALMVSLPVIFPGSLTPPTLFPGAKTEDLSFVPYMLVMLLVIGVFVFPAFVFLGLLYGTIRRAVRVERQGGAATDNQ